MVVVIAVEAEEDIVNLGELEVDAAEEETLSFVLLLCLLSSLSNEDSFLLLVVDPDDFPVVEEAPVVILPATSFEGFLLLLLEIEVWDLDVFVLEAALTTLLLST